MSVHVGVRGPGHLARTFQNPWTPSQLTSVVAWWDATQGVTESGGLVSAWADRVGGAAVTQSNGSLKPVVSATSMNSAYYGITGDGSDDVLSLASLPASVPSGSTAGWMFALVSQDALAADTTTRVPLGYGDNLASGNSRNVIRAVNTGVNRLRVGDSGATGEETTVDFSGVCAVMSYFTGVTMFARINGVESSSAIWTPNTATTRTRLFSATGAAAAAFFQGVISHAIIGTGAITTADKERLEAWALWSVGAQSKLPANHTYKNARP